MPQTSKALPVVQIELSTITSRDWTTNCLVTRQPEKLHQNREYFLMQTTMETFISHSLLWDCEIRKAESFERQTQSQGEELPA